MVLGSGSPVAVHEPLHTSSKLLANYECLVHPSGNLIVLNRTLRAIVQQLFPFMLRLQKDIGSLGATSALCRSITK